MEYIKDLDYLDLIRILNMSYEFEPSKRPFLKQQSSIDYKNRRTAYDDDDDSNKFSSLPSSLSKSTITSINEIKEEIDTIQVDDNQLRFIYKSVDLKVEIFQEDLLETRADVIVNAANNRLQLGGGVADAINSKTGDKVRDESDNFISTIYQRQLGDTKVYTESFDSFLNLLMFYILNR